MLWSAYLPADLSSLISLCVCVCCSCACLTLCPMNLNARSCGLKFHTMTTWSAAPDASCLSDGANDTDVTAPLCPRKLRSSVGSLAAAALPALGVDRVAADIGHRGEEAVAGVHTRKKVSAPSPQLATYPRRHTVASPLWVSLLVHLTVQVFAAIPATKKALIKKASSSQQLPIRTLHAGSRTPAQQSEFEIEQLKQFLCLVVARSKQPHPIGSLHTRLPKH